MKKTGDRLASFILWAFAADITSAFVKTIQQILLGILVTVVIALNGTIV